jgi:hypothetical protein
MTKQEATDQLKQQIQASPLCPSDLFIVLLAGAAEIAKEHPSLRVWAAGHFGYAMRRMRELGMSAPARRGMPS